MISALLSLALVGEARPDVVVFMLDDVATADVATVETPAIDGLRALGTDFTHGYSMPMCAPSRWSFLLSSWTPGNAGFGCQPDRRNLSHGLDSFPKLMEGAGYSTALFGRWGLGGLAIGEQPPVAGAPADSVWAPTAWGFDVVRACLIDGAESCGGSGYSDWFGVDDGVGSLRSSYHTTAVQDAFIEHWTAPRTEPRFAWVSLQAAHEPFHYPPASAMPPGWVEPPFPNTRIQFEAMIRSADFAIGNMLSFIDLSTTLVLLVSDNGTPPSARPINVAANRVKFSTFQRGVHVPFVAAGLGVPMGGTVRQPVSLVDVLPTLADVAGVEPFASSDGQSLLPALRGERLERDWVYVQKGPLDDHAAIEERWKLRVSAGGNELLYDLVADPGEAAPIRPGEGRDDVFARLRGHIARAQGTASTQRPMATTPGATLPARGVPPR